MKQKVFFIIFEGLSLKQMKKKKKFERDSPTLRKSLTTRLQFLNNILFI